MRILTAVAFLALAAFTAGAADEKGDAAKEVAKKLEGTYEVVDVLVAGKTDAKKNELKGVEIKDGQIIMKTEKRDEKAKLVLDASKKPAEIDIIPGGDIKVVGIYETKETDKGLELTIAAAMGPNAARPTDFKGAGKEELVLKLLRKKK